MQPQPQEQWLERQLLTCASMDSDSSTRDALEVEVIGTSCCRQSLGAKQQYVDEPWCRKLMSEEGSADRFMV